MASTDHTEELVLKYFHSWPKGHFEAMHACLEDDMDFDRGSAQVSGADELKLSAE